MVTFDCDEQVYGRKLLFGLTKKAKMQQEEPPFALLGARCHRVVGGK